MLDVENPAAIVIEDQATLTVCNEPSFHFVQAEEISFEYIVNALWNILVVIRHPGLMRVYAWGARGRSI